MIPTGQQIIQQSTGEGFELLTRTKHGLYFLALFCLLLATMGSISTPDEQHLQEQTIGALFSPSPVAFGVPFNKGLTLGKEMGMLSKTAAAGMYSPVHNRQLLN